MWDLLIVIIPGAFTTVLTIGVMHDTKKGPWNPRRKWGPQHKQLLKAKTALLDMSEFKKQRRIEDRQKWATEFEQLSGPGEDLEPAASPTVDERMRQLWNERDKQKQKQKQETIIRNADGETIVVLPSGGARVGPRITHSSEVPRPQPPRGPGSVSSPRQVVNGPSPIMVGNDIAYPVRMGKFVGHYVVRHDDWDSLLDKDNWSVLEAYEDGHYSTCPYECDCPKWARRY